MTLKITDDLILISVFMVLISCAGQSRADNGMIKVELPDYVTWCVPLILSEESSSDEEGQRSILDAALKTMDKALSAENSEFSSMPFTTNIKKLVDVGEGGDEENKVSFDFCYIVDPSLHAPSSAEVKVVKVSGERVAALACARALEMQCIEKLQVALSDTLPSIAFETIKNFPWRYVTTADAPVGTESVAFALTSYHVRPVLGSAKVSESGDYKLVDPKVMRPLLPPPDFKVKVVPTEQGKWYVSAIILPSEQAVASPSEP